MTAARHTFLVIETNLPSEGTIAEYRRSRAAARRAGRGDRRRRRSFAAAAARVLAAAGQ